MAQAQQLQVEIQGLIKKHHLRPYHPELKESSSPEVSEKVRQLAIDGVKQLIEASKLQRQEEVDALLGLWAAAVEFDLGNDIAAVNESLLRPHLAQINQRIEEMEKMKRPPIDKKLLLAIAVALAGELSGSRDGNG